MTAGTADRIMPAPQSSRRANQAAQAHQSECKVDRVFPLEGLALDETGGVDEFVCVSTRAIPSPRRRTQGSKAETANRCDSFNWEVTPGPKGPRKVIAHSQPSDQFVPGPSNLINYSLYRILRKSMMCHSVTADRMTGRYELLHFVPVERALGLSASVYRRDIVAIRKADTGYVEKEACSSPAPLDLLTDPEAAAKPIVETESR